MTKHLAALLAICLALGACDRGTIWKTDTFSLDKDGITQTEGGRFRASAPDAGTLVSDYPDTDIPGGAWHQSRDLGRFARYQAPSTWEEAMYNLSLEESENAVEADSTLRTGRSWAGVWTRDVSYSTLLAMALVQTESARKSLECKLNSRGRIIQDTGTGGSWPVSTDRIIWAVAAWEIYKVTGDEAWLDKIYPAIKCSLEDDILTDYNPVTGLVKGESSYLDWREQEYPLWMDPSDIYNSENLGTNCVHYRALRILAEIERLKGGGDAGRYDAFADKIKEGINRHLWMEDQGFYAQYLYGRQFLTASPRSETLGEARDEALNEAEDEAAVADAGWDGSGLSAGGLVFMVPATDEVLAPYDDFDVFNYDPGVQPLLFYTERDIPNFRLVSVTMENDGGELVFRPDQLLYQRNWLNPERPSLIQILPRGDINSGFGITFTDPEDPETEHFYILSPTGRGEAGDPPLVFTEIY